MRKMKNNVDETKHGDNTSRRSIYTVLFVDVVAVTAIYVSPVVDSHRIGNGIRHWSWNEWLRSCMSPYS